MKSSIKEVLTISGYSCRNIYLVEHFGIANFRALDAIFYYYYYFFVIFTLNICLFVSNNKCDTESGKSKYTADTKNE